MFCKISSLSSALAALQFSTEIVANFKYTPRSPVFASRALFQRRQTFCGRFSWWAVTISATHQTREKRSKPLSIATTCRRVGTRLLKRDMRSENLFISHWSPTQCFASEQLQHRWSVLRTVSTRLALNRSASGEPSFGCAGKSPQMPRCWFTQKAQIQYLMVSPCCFARRDRTRSMPAGVKRSRATGPYSSCPMASVNTADTKCRNKLRHSWVTMHSA
mmetsp:Transcript_24142/g.52538  ORF Transcript_24142/g.52538 Transcript_24142/m.52538 type:complete len:218 (+) Transcript_24142:278-931(+)